MNHYEYAQCKQSFQHYFSPILCKSFDTKATHCNMAVVSVLKKKSTLDVDYISFIVVTRDITKHQGYITYNILKLCYLQYNLYEITGMFLSFTWVGSIVLSGVHWRLPPIN